jgi:hypothetical protein
MKILGFILAVMILSLGACPSGEQKTDDGVDTTPTTNTCLNVVCEPKQQCNEATGTCECIAEHHLEDNQCVSNVRMILCDNTDIPRNARVSLIEVENTWEQEKGDWKPILPCEWECEEGLVREGNNCLSATKVKNVLCDSSQVPVNATPTLRDVIVRWDPEKETWSVPAGCAWQCNHGYHFGGNACESNTRYVRCDDTGAPSHADVILQFVTNYWDNGRHEWKPIPPCRWTCATGYHQVDDTCVASERKVMCDGRKSPANAKSISQEMQQTWNPQDKTWNPIPVCPWECLNDFHREADQCVANQRSVICNSHGTPVNATAIEKKVTQHWNIISETWDVVPVCEWTCKSNFHRENNACFSNNKEVTCDGSNTPANANATVKNVQITWDEKTNKWKPIPACEWTCKANFHRENNACLSNTKEVKCDDSKTPANANAVVKNVQITWDEKTNKWNPIPTCEWECKTTFHLENNACISDVRTVNCERIGIPNHADPILKSVQQHWNASEKKWGPIPKCDWTCRNGYHQEGNQCLSNLRSVTCDDSETPPNAQAEIRTVLQVFNVDENRWGAVPKCKWTCNEAFHIENNTCVSNTRVVDCDSSKAPQQATVTVIKVENTWNKLLNQWNLVESCSWKCHAGWHGKDCDFQCNKGQYNGDFTASSTNDGRIIAGYTSITGNLTISRSLPELDSFACLQRIGKNMQIVGNFFKNLEGLNQLTHIGGSLTLSNLNFLTSLPGLEKLASIGQDFIISSNLTLRDLQGLTNLKQIGGDLKINNNNRLGYQVSRSYDTLGLNALEHIGGDLVIESNDEIRNITGLSGLNTIAGSLIVSNNWFLASLEGMSQLTTIGDSLVIRGNALANLDDLSKLTHIGKSIQIFSTRLESIDRLSTLHNKSFASITLEHTPAIKRLPSFKNLESITGDIKIQATGLDSLKGLDSLSVLGGSLNISKNNLLTSLEGLNQLNSIGGSLLIAENNELRSIHALRNLRRLASSMEIVENPSLTTLSGLDGITSPSLSLIDITNNRKLQNLQNLSPKITSVTGDLIINGNDVLTSLRGLENITRVEGWVAIIDIKNLTSLEGLHHISGTIKGLAIISNPALEYINNIKNITHIEGFLEVRNNGELRSLESLDHLTSIGSLYLSSNPKIKTLAGLHNLKNSSLDSLIINSNATLDVVDAFTSVTTVTSDINLSGNGSLNSLAGLKNINRVGRHLNVFNNYTLESLDGLHSITAVGRDLTISKNYHLKNLMGLRGLQQIGGNATITENHTLRNSEAEALLYNHIGVKRIGGRINIGSNNMTAP